MTQVFQTFTARFPEAIEHAFAQAYGDERWRKMQRALVVPPRYTAVRVNTMQTTRTQAMVALNKELQAFHEAQPQFPLLQSIEHATLPDVVIIPSAPPQQPPVVLNEAMKTIIVDRLCGEAVLRGSDIFCRGVMSASSGISVGDRVNVFVDLDHIQTRGSDASDHHGRKMLIAHGTMTMARTEVFRAMRGLAVTDLTRVCWNAPPLNGVMSGLLYVQNLPSMVVAHNLNPQPGDVIIDMCAAPGGKTSHIATLMQDRGILIACDKSKRKAQELKRLFSSELVFDIVTPLHLDTSHSVLPAATTGPVLSVQQVIDQAVAASHANTKKSKNADDKKPRLLPIKGFHAETFDKILLDPPCSALGLRPRLLHDVNESDLAIFTSMQRNLLWAAVYLLKPGGTLVYSTCTINPDENERMMQHAIEQYPLRLERQDVHLGASGLELADGGLPVDQAKLVQRFDPSDENLDTMGFFCAKLTKTHSIRTSASKIDQ